MSEGSSAPENELKQSTSSNSATGLRKLLEKTKLRISGDESKNDRSIRESILKASNQIKDEEITVQTQRADEAEKVKMIDDLTGLYTKKWFEEELIKSIYEARRYGTSLWLIYADIDHFKGINDKHGHAMGDEILRKFGEIGSREDEPIARIGGEEFAQIIHRGLKMDDIRTILSRYSANFKESSRNSLGYEATLSFGIVELSPDDTPSSIKEKADKALYEAKESGRDRAALLEGSLFIPIELTPQIPQETGA